MPMLLMPLDLPHVFVVITHALSFSQSCQAYCNTVITLAMAFLQSCQLVVPFALTWLYAHMSIEQGGKHSPPC